MPTYTYLCEQNQPPTEYEAIHSIAEELTECPFCKEKGLPYDHKPKRLISMGSAFILKRGGVGWSETGYSKK